MSIPRRGADTAILKKFNGINITFASKDIVNVALAFDIGRKRANIYVERAAAITRLRRHLIS